MTEFVHECRGTRFTSGELKPTTGINEAYKDKHGDIALTSQIENLFNYGDQRITAEHLLLLSEFPEKLFGKREK